MENLNGELLDSEMNDSIDMNNLGSGESGTEDYTESSSENETTEDTINTNNEITDLPGENNQLDTFNNDNSSNLINIYTNPITKHAYITHDEIRTSEDFSHIGISFDFTDEQLQGACNQIGDVLHWKHLPVEVTEEVANAAWSPGILSLFRLDTVMDDKLYLNKEYAQDCFEKQGTTEIVKIDMAHEYGHSMAQKLCKPEMSKNHEKVADFVSGFVANKLDIDLNIAKDWFEDNYIEEDGNGYPDTKERWDITQAGYKYANYADGNELKIALADEDFFDLIKQYGA